MKKLMMFAAAMTIVGGAYAQCGDPDPIDRDCMLTYNVKMNLRTVTGRALKHVTAPDLCGEGTVTGGCVRFPKVALTLEGYLFVCGCECDMLEEADETWLFLGNKKLQTTLQLGSFEFEFLHILGNGKSAEAAWTLEVDDDNKGLIGPFDLTGTGFGTFNTKQNLYTAFSGGTVGYLYVPQCIAPGAQSCETAGYWICDGSFEFEDASVIYGTWGMKLNTKLSGYVAGANTSAMLRKAFPTWAYTQFLNDGAFEPLFGLGN